MGEYKSDHVCVEQKRERKQYNNQQPRKKNRLHYSASVDCSGRLTQDVYVMRCVDAELLFCVHKRKLTWGRKKKKRKRCTVFIFKKVFGLSYCMMICQRRLPPSFFVKKKDSHMCSCSGCNPTSLGSHSNRNLVQFPKPVCCCRRTTNKYIKKRNGSET